MGATLPSLPERAGKYEYQVLVDDGTGVRSVTGDRPVYARYKAPVPNAVLLVHILLVFLSMTLALRTGIAALTGGEVSGLAVGHHRVAPPRGLRARAPSCRSTPSASGGRAFPSATTGPTTRCSWNCWAGPAPRSRCSSRAIPAARVAVLVATVGHAGGVLHPPQHLRLRVRLHPRLRSRNRGVGITPGPGGYIPGNGKGGSSKYEAGQPVKSFEESASRGTSPKAASQGVAAVSIIVPAEAPASVAPEASSAFIIQ